MYKCQGRGSTDWLDSCPSSSRIVCSRNSIFSMTRKNSAECVVFVCWRDCWWTGSAVLDSVMHATYTIQWTDTSTFFSFYSPKCKLSDTRKFRLEEMTVPCTVGRMHVVKRPLVLTSTVQTSRQVELGLLPHLTQFCVVSLQEIVHGVFPVSFHACAPQGHEVKGERVYHAATFGRGSVHHALPVLLTTLLLPIALMWLTVSSCLPSSIFSSCTRKIDLPEVTEEACCD